MVGKYALICTMEIQKIHMVVHILAGFALFTELMWVYRGVESLCKLLTANKVLFDLPTKILSILKVVSVESLAGNDFSERGTQAEAHCERNLNRPLLDEKHRIAVQGIFAGIIIKAGGASVTVTDLFFAFAFCEKQTRKTGVLARLAFCWLLI